MLATALAQLRHAVAMMRGSRIDDANVRRLVADMRRTVAEFGAVGGGQQELIAGAPLDPDVRALVDTKRMRKAAVAASRTPFYAELFARTGRDPAKLSLADLDGWPITPKQALKELPEAFVVPGSAPALVAQTTGTTGQPTTVWLSDYELRLLAATSAAALMFTNGLGSSDVMHLALCSRSSVAVLTMTEACRLVGAGVVMGGMVAPGQTLDRLARPVRVPGKKPKASYLDVNPSYLAALLQEAMDRGLRGSDFGLEVILCGGEVLSDALARRVEEFFGARVSDSYAMTEIVPVGGLVCSERHLHWPAEQGYVELLDPVTGRPAAPGELATLVVTPFPPYRETTLLFRFDTGDLVRRLDADPVTCELARLPAASRLLGKASLAASGGARAVTTRDVLDVLEAEEALRLPARYAIVPADGGVDLHVLAPSAGRGLVSRLEGRIAGAGLPVRRLLLHDDIADLPAPAPVRADLRERTFGDPGTAPHPRPGRTAAVPAPVLDEAVAR